MELSWYGLGCVRLVERNFPSVVIDPFNGKYKYSNAPRLQADIVISNAPIDEPERTQWQGLHGVGRTIAGPGEYEIGGVFVTGIATYGPKDGDGVSLENDIYSVDINGVRLCHLGRLASNLTQSQIEPIGHIHVLCVPVGLEDGIRPNQAADLVSMLEPDIVVPIYYDTPDCPMELKDVEGFVKAMGVEQRTVLPTLKLTAGMDSESTQVILLEVSH